VRTGIECAAHHLLESCSINPHSLICILTRPLFWTRSGTDAWPVTYLEGRQYLLRG
jgi:hypothetical protein